MKLKAEINYGARPSSRPMARHLIASVVMSRTQDVKAQLKTALAAAKAGKWSDAHEGVQALEDLGDPLASWLHANLHREEGDLGNARYWYRQAGREVFQGDLAAELEAIGRALDSI
jgi:hypothetical protein